MSTAALNAANAQAEAERQSAEELSRAKLQVSPPPAVFNQNPPRQQLPLVPAGYVGFLTSRPPLTLVVKLGGETATRSGGAGGWQQVDRPGLPAATRWQGLPLWEMTVPLLFDGFSARLSVEAACETLTAMSRQQPGQPRGSRPPVVRVGGMVPHGDREWVIQAIEWGEAIWDGAVRVRQWATVSLLEHVPEDLIPLERATTSGSAGAANTSIPTRSYTVKRGESLASIAKDELGARNQKEVAEGVAVLKRLNAIRDPKSIKPGQKLKIPRETAYASTVGGAVGGLGALGL